MILKAAFLSIVKGQDITILLVREDKKVFICFGDEKWFDFEQIPKLGNISKLTEKAKRKYESWIKSKSFKRNYRETMEVVETSSDYEEIIQKFIKDFKKDRGNRIWRNDVEIDPKVKEEDIQYEYKR